MAELKHKDWEVYQKQMGSTPRKHVLQALEYFEKNPPAGKTAIDLGCGNGRDTLTLLTKGWKVLAVDKAPQSIEFLKENIAPELQQHLEIQGKPFEQVDWVETNLVNACASLPFCDAEHFLSVWEHLEKSIVPGGVFAGNFFGVNDSWNGRVICFNLNHIHTLFQNFEILDLEEREFDKESARGPLKHWHVFDILAKKK